MLKSANPKGWLTALAIKSAERAESKLDASSDITAQVAVKEKLLVLRGPAKWKKELRKKQVRPVLNGDQRYFWTIPK